MSKMVVLFVRFSLCIPCTLHLPPQEASNEYSHLDPQKGVEAADENEGGEEDPYMELGELEANDLMQFAYQIATGMVRNF